MIGGSLLTFITVAGLVIAIPGLGPDLDFYRAKPSVRLTPAERPDPKDPLSTLFILHNDGNVPIENLDYKFILVHMKTAGGMGGQNNQFFYTYTPPTRLGVGREVTVSFPRNLGIPRDFIELTLRFELSYEAENSDDKRHQSWTFRGIPTADGSLVLTPHDVEGELPTGG